MMDAKRTKGVSISYIKRLDSSDSYFDCLIVLTHTNLAKVS